MTKLHLSNVGDPDVRPPRIRVFKDQRFMIHVWRLGDKTKFVTTMDLTLCGQGPLMLAQYRYCLRKVAQLTSSAVDRENVRIVTSILRGRSRFAPDTHWEDISMEGDRALAWLAWSRRPRSLKGVGALMLSFLSIGHTCPNKPKR